MPSPLLKESPSVSGTGTRYPPPARGASASNGLAVSCASMLTPLGKAIKPWGRKVFRKLERAQIYSTSERKCRSPLARVGVAQVVARPLAMRWLLQVVTLGAGYSLPAEIGRAFPPPSHSRASYSPSGYLCGWRVPIRSGRLQQIARPGGKTCGFCFLSD